MSKTLTQLEAADFINRSFKPLPRSYGDALVEAALKDERIVALCADLVPPTETDRFRRKRSVSVGGTKSAQRATIRSSFKAASTSASP